MKTGKVALTRLGKKVKHVGHGVQPPQERNDRAPAHARLCERCASIPMGLERLDQMAVMWRKRDTGGIWRLYEIQELVPQNCDFCRLLLET
jgi:hypothetical protein